MKILKLIKRNLPFLIILSGALIASFSLLTPGIPPTHDGEYHVLRFQQFYKLLSEGNLYPRWAPDFNNGFGIPLFNYVYPLPNYIASFLHFIGFSFIDSFKLNMILAIFIGAIFFYLWAKIYWGELGGTVSAIFYTFSPYHFVDIYVRGSVGEVWGLAIFPILLWSITKYFDKKKNIYFVISSISLALLVYTHNILAVLFFIFFIFYSIFLSVKKSRKTSILDLILIIFIGLGLSSPFWLPAIFEIHYVRGLQIFDPRQNFPEIYQLLIPSWGYGLTPRDLLNPMSVQIGVANLLAFLMSLIILLKTKKKSILLFFILSFIFVFFLMTQYSAFVWKNFPLFSYFQFPWRLLSLEILIASFIAGSIISIIKNKNMKIAITFLLIVLSVGLSIGYARGAAYYNRDDRYYLTRSNFTDGTNSVGNVFNTKWLETMPKKTETRFDFIEGSGTLQVLDLKSTHYKIRVLTQKDSKIVVNTAFFPGWVYKIDKEKYDVENLNGRILLAVPKGINHIDILLTSTLIQKLAYLYLLFSILLLFIVRRTGIIRK